MQRTKLGIIGGSGLYDLPGLEDATWRRIETPWGEASDALLFGRLGDLELVFLPRHGRPHRVPPSHINYRANIDAMKRAGVTDLVSFSACGSFREELEPGRFVVVDQFIDRTFAREKSFFGIGCVAHVAFGDPVSPLLSSLAAESAQAAAVPLHRGGTYLAMEGPQFSTVAESRLYRSWGCDVIGMTNMPEAKLAREAELPYASVAMVTDYDSWHEDHGTVDVPTIVATMHANGDKARATILKLAAMMPREHPPCPIGSDRALDFAIVTPVAERDPTLMAKLDAVAGRVLAREAAG
jgi:5'-methylthioadenosine phosphorylase